VRRFFALMSKLLYLLASCAPVLSTALAVAQVGVAPSPVPGNAQTLHYGSDPLQFGTLRLPKANGSVPIVILVHGGCWADHFPGPPGSHPSPDATLLEPLAAALTDGGVATWNIEYRRTGSPNGTWRSTYLDLAAAVDYLRTIAHTYKLDLANVTVLGHSSGGQLALWLGARSKLPKTSELYTPDPLALKDIIDIDGPPDLAAAQPSESQFCPMPAITQFTGGTPAEMPTRYRDGSAQAFLPLGIPQIIVTAALLQSQPNLVESYASAAKAKGDSVTVVTLVSPSHFAMLKPDTLPGKVVLTTILTAAKPKQ
jgi:acetyl esterase/lipase